MITVMDTEANGGMILWSQRLKPSKRGPRLKTQDEVTITPSEKKQKQSAHEARKLKAITNVKKDRKEIRPSKTSRENRPMASTPVKESDSESKKKKQSEKKQRQKKRVTKLKKTKRLTTND